MPKDYFNYLPLVIALLIVLRRSGRARKVRVERAWITPTLAVLGVWTTLSREPLPGGAALALLVAAALIGIGAGYYRALHIELSLDPESGQVMSKATPFGTIWSPSSSSSVSASTMRSMADGVPDRRAS
jgi:hypothetical protein